ncbi:MAG TPA: winged helix-turn-helix transcriptional regulator, partial [Intrasporangium sp.]|nr:winged helix-turn-helix transcriptional regulator [Intrasporangium sp.]
MPSQRRRDSKNPRAPYRTPPPRPLDATDRALVQALLDDGRLSNADLARRVGLPESTCSGRVRVLSESGVIRGIHADV